MGIRPPHFLLTDWTQAISDLIPSPLLDDFEALLDPVKDVSAFPSLSSSWYVSPPNPRFSRVIAADLRQTPEHLRGELFQKFVLLATQPDKDPVPFPVCRRLFLLSTLLQDLQDAHHAAKAAREKAEEVSREWWKDCGIHRPLEISPGGDATAAATAAAGGETDEANAEGEAKVKLLELRATEFESLEMFCLDRFSECLDLSLDGATGEQLALLRASEVESAALQAWKQSCVGRLQEIAQRRREHARLERVLDAQETQRLKRWSATLRVSLQRISSALQATHCGDSCTTGSIAFALATLLAETGEVRPAVQHLRAATANLEEELDSLFSAGFDHHFDLASAQSHETTRPLLERSGLSTYTLPGIPEETDWHTGGAGRDEDGIKNEIQHTPRSEPRSPLAKRTLTLHKSLQREMDNARTLQLTSEMNRTIRPVADEDLVDLGVLIDTSKVPLSNFECNILGDLGDNPYARCLFWCTLARRRSDGGERLGSVGKALREAERCERVEQDLWSFTQKKCMRNSQHTETEGGRKVPPTPAPLLVGRGPRSLRFSLPTGVFLHDGWSDDSLGPGVPGVVPERDEQNVRVTLFGKRCGSGTTEMKLQKGLSGTGVQFPGMYTVEASDLQPNIHYMFACQHQPDGDVGEQRAFSAPISDPTPPIESVASHVETLLRGESRREQTAGDVQMAAPTRFG
eukprot:Cvel_14883.t1-p1 / transcript=Cvel_14883.t1 / gene=Cvel_14883 / organism=Chromera_velia_CCMP2878 / gene_product=hypothetical protein / transcript_product=hypothetical protein / location=Cvel_scaffold1076:51706-56772(+) / protein_length=688 / sequence_SO=supercontig / SO=protein_coding / is_pseudo=false